MSYKLLTREEPEFNLNRVLQDDAGNDVAFIRFVEDAEFIEMAVNEHQRLVDRVRALDAKCALLAASLTKADAAGAVMLSALLAVQPIVKGHAVGTLDRLGNLSDLNAQLVKAIGAGTEIY